MCVEIGSDSTHEHNTNTNNTNTHNQPRKQNNQTTHTCSALTAFLYRGGGPRYRVDAAFVWSVGTWDVAAVHPISTSLEGTYADWEVVKWMRWLSAQAAAAGGRKRAAEV